MNNRKVIFFTGNFSVTHQILVATLIKAGYEIVGDWDKADIVLRGNPGVNGTALKQAKSKGVSVIDCSDYLIDEIVGILS